MIKINNNFYLTIAVAVSIGIFFVAGQISGTLSGTGLHGIAHIAALFFSRSLLRKGPAAFSHGHGNASDCGHRWSARTL